MGARHFIDAVDSSGKLHSIPSYKYAVRLARLLPLADAEPKGLAYDVYNRSSSAGVRAGRLDGSADHTVRMIG